MSVIFSHLVLLTWRAGALFDVDSKLQAHAAFRYEMERYNNISASSFKLDKYEKIVDVTDSFQLTKAGQ